MTSFSIAQAAQVFVSATAFGVLINMYSVQILKTFWSTYDLSQRTLLTSNRNVIVRKLLGKRAIQHIEGKTAFFPLVELTFASLVLLALSAHGLTWQFVRTVAFLALALPMAAISALDDPESSYTPDSLTITGALLGVMTSWLPGAMNGSFFWMFYKLDYPTYVIQALGGVASSVVGAALGYFSLFFVFVLFRAATGKEGMGEGCFKANMMICAFGGWQILPQVVVLSALGGAIIATILNVTGRVQIGQYFPFTPFQVAAGVIALIWGDDLNSWYLKAAGLAVFVDA
jgi:leader peptidase (prepilin peptidase)/N-methyltransferase